MPCAGGRARPAVYESMGISVLESERGVETLCGRDYETLSLTAGASGVTLIDKVTISKKGSEFRVYAQGTVYDVTIDSVTYINDDVGFYQTDALLARFAAEP